MYLAIVVVVIIVDVIVVAAAAVVLLLMSAAAAVVMVVIGVASTAGYRTRYTRSGGIAPSQYPHDGLTHPTSFGAFAVKCHCCCCCCCCSSYCNCCCCCGCLLKIRLRTAFKPFLQAKKSANLTVLYIFILIWCCCCNCFLSLLLFKLYLGFFLFWRLKYVCFVFFLRFYKGYNGGYL